jgi:cell division septation protein DedD
MLIVATGGFFYFVSPRPAMASMFPWKETAAAPTLATGASFSVTVASLESGDGVGTAAGRVRTLGLPAFTRLSPDRSQLHQAMVGPYASLDEAERVQRRLGRSGFTGARIFVDESLRNAPRNELHADAAQGNPTVILLGAPDRVSLVFEMPLEPRQVRSRRSDNMLDLDVGPMANPVRPQQWSAPEGVHLVEGVAMDGIAAGESGLFMRAHVAVPKFARANVRTEGRRVYVDLTWPQVAPDANAPRSAFQAPTQAPTQAQPAPKSVAAAKPEAAAPRDEAQLGVKYGDALRPVLARVAAVKPFVMSATQSGSPDVLGALDETLATLEASLKAMHAPATALDQHQLLISAIATARRAVNPAFSGDRSAQAREAFVLYDAAMSTASLTPAAQ